MSDTMFQPRMPLLPQLDDDLVTRLLLALGLFMVASFVVFIPAWLLDPRILDGANVWTKPQKFNVSLALHFFTLAILAQQVPRATRSGWIMVGFAYAAALSLMLEFVWISIQAGRARRSHFNFETPMEASMYALMGLGAFLLIAVAFVLAIQIWRKGDRSRPGLRWGSILGLSLGFATSLVFANYLSAHGRYVGGDPDYVGAVLPFFGWSREIGDLRPAHFVSLHLMQTLPLAGYLADRMNWPAIPVVLGLAIVQVGIAIALFLQALAGQPMWPV
ncbi:hypothetical protein [Parerythrobacter jejuensis]|uniref:Uncharacterized protein n=1 Tax=Parerythrobacter jejuensis TaxID=795812 RepID=A0A845AZC9_9SPHN|nr:hypothetical protein [Parerythrobacter jejuensis]MXP31351.1 hypothetical protein [Parerythrobacter jejuensis]MXP34111.1 hypothetical protein [Parerythrobacter jejuensis]